MIAVITKDLYHGNADVFVQIQLQNLVAKAKESTGMICLVLASAYPDHGGQLALQDMHSIPALIHVHAYPYQNMLPLFWKY